MAEESFVGRAGQLAVMAEFLLRGYNVAIPEVDVGDDVLVVDDGVEQVWRVQVKTAVGVQRSHGYSGQFLVAVSQIESPGRTPFYFVFALRREAAWDFVVIPRRDLLAEVELHGAGSRTGRDRRFYLAFQEANVICSGRDWQPYRNNWSPWPIIRS